MSCGTLFGTLSCPMVHYLTLCRVLWYIIWHSVMPYGTLFAMLLCSCALPTLPKASSALVWQSLRRHQPRVYLCLDVFLLQVIKCSGPILTFFPTGIVNSVSLRFGSVTIFWCFFFFSLEIFCWFLLLVQRDTIYTDDVSNVLVTEFHK